MKKQSTENRKVLDHFQPLTNQDLENISGGANWFTTLIEKLKPTKNILP
ncbi:ComC/BlpC family leader-containing pheromone/bacteriocin [Streptococcus hyovaginalis]|nr:ComC/BlpC family leader-containing pheromone/bacteriocin [Streptococcus hyovaginalis]